MYKHDRGWAVKTAHKMYDKVVALIMLRAYLLAPELVDLASDGEWDEEWECVSGGEGGECG